MANVVNAEERIQLHVMLLDVGPAPWRRFLIRPETTIDELHRLIQLCMGWGEHSWHEFRIHGNLEFGRRRGYGGTDPSGAGDRGLSSFCLNAGERFRYNYGGWRCQLRLEKVVVVDRPHVWPICTGGKWSPPPEHCGDGLPYMTDRRRIRHPMELMEQLAEVVEEAPQDAAWFRERAKRVTGWGRWMHFDRARLNTRLCTANLAWEEETDDAFPFATGD